MTKWVRTYESEMHKYISPRHVEKGVNLFEFKVTLEDTSPEIWRRIVVPGNFTLEQLGRVAGCVIGWIPRCFSLHGPDDGEFIYYNPWGDDLDVEDPEPHKKKPKVQAPKKNIISEVFNLTDKRSVMMDYGNDGWIHEITLEKIRERDLKLYPKCIDGKNACPPEDVFGPEAYKDLINAVRDPKNKEHANMKEWLKDMGYKRFSPTRFSVKSVKIGDPF